MALNLIVEYADTEKAVRELNTNQLIQQIKAGTSPSGLSLTQPSIKISPEPSVASSRREIVWNLALQIAKSDESTEAEFEEVVNALFDGAQAAAGQAMSAASGLPMAGKDVLLTIGRTMGRVSNALKGQKATRVIQIDALPVRFEGRLNRDVTLTAKIFFEALWTTDDPDDSGNKAWFELESFKIGTFVDLRSSPNQWDAASWDSRGGAPSGHHGRSFMEPHGEEDETGVFKTQPGSNPRPDLASVSFSPIALDETDVSATVSINARADDTVFVLVYRMRLLLIASAPPLQFVGNFTEGVQLLIDAADEELVGAFAMLDPKDGARSSTGKLDERLELVGSKKRSKRERS